ncbi:histidine phosphatase family protein [uncultured Methanoregula sp.]|uniref:histidine phosphatase family protein n=1 Tax=uncultured Methanoregula sp. TaxID=1005933 RepID=UPI002AAC1517|nr:histidine phosphatase family protein [uncultured Methanoregula sp.]
MKPGDYVLDLLREVPESGRTIVLIRHSARNSFDGIPEPLREGVEITPDGVRLAEAFGKSLAEIFTGKPLLLGHTVAHRCRMTARSIGDGYSPADSVRILGCQPEIGSPVVDPDNYVTLRSELGWREGIRRWLGQEIPEDTMRNPHTYSDEILSNLLSFPQAGENDLLIVVAHDITLFPIIFSIFGKNVTAVEFLNGIVITLNTTTAEIRYNDGKFSLKAERNII